MVSLTIGKVVLPIFFLAVVTLILTLNLEGDLIILKMNLHTVNEVATLQHLKLSLPGSTVVRSLHFVINRSWV